ncbi:hypothetical protein ACO2Q3_07720 [Caulobacter sp. KR2-114]|uniref:hypothetical protein n=1 Tax=Caulobacter sp. KR2-114 TaxID=3400912 RepID=UPI003C0B4DC7
MDRRSLAGVETSVHAFQRGETARGVLANLKWLWRQIRGSWLESMDIAARTGRDIWRPPFM